jgi:hypothetical protein
MQLHVRMSSRDPEEAHRASTPLELFFDLTFVVAIAEAGASVHHGLVARPGRRRPSWLSPGVFRGYGHYLVFLSAAAVGAGLAVAVDQVTHHSELSHLQAALALTVPAAAYLLTVWALHVRYKPPSLLRNYAVPITAALILASAGTPQPALITGGLLAALVVINVLVGPPVVASLER